MTRIRLSRWVGLCAALAVVLLVAATRVSVAAESLAGDGIPSFCKDLPNNLRIWFEANAAMFHDRVDSTHRPMSAEVCYRNGALVVLAAWDIAGDNVQKEEDTWTSEFYLYYPTVNKVVLFMNTPYDYVTSVMANYWQRSVEYPPKTIWVVELRNGSDLLRTAFFDNRGDLMSTGEIIVAVEGKKPQSFKVNRTGKSALLDTPKGLGGELTQQGLVYQFFGLLKP